MSHFRKDSEFRSSGECPTFTGTALSAVIVKVRHSSELWNSEFHAQYNCAHTAIHGCAREVELHVNLMICSSQWSSTSLKLHYMQFNMELNSIATSHTEITVQLNCDEPLWSAVHMESHSIGTSFSAVPSQSYCIRTRIDAVTTQLDCVVTASSALPYCSRYRTGGDKCRLGYEGLGHRKYTNRTERPVIMSTISCRWYGDLAN